MNKNIVYVLFISIVLFSCKPKTSEENKVIVREARGSVAYGGTLNITETEPYFTLYPYDINDMVSFRIAYQIYEGLVRYNTRNMEVEPAIAKDWTIDSTGTIYTFRLKDNVFFHDNNCFPDGKGRNVTANDFKYSFEKLCSNEDHALAFEKTFKGKVKGANAFFNDDVISNSFKSIEGIKVINKYELQIELVKPSSSFLSVLALPYCCVIPKEGVEKYNKKLNIGTGPYQIAHHISSEQTLTLIRNNNYHRSDSFGNVLPYIDTILISYINDKGKIFDSFKHQQIDIVTGVQSKTTKEFIINNESDFKIENQKYAVQNISDMITYFIAFNNKHSLFSNKEVRKAFASAIDKEKLVKKILNTDETSNMGDYGITPLVSNIFAGYDTVLGIKYDVINAKKRLAESGFSDRSKIPTINLKINQKENENTIIALELFTQLKANVDINICYQQLSSFEHNKAMKEGDFDLILVSIAGDYPSPESFLQYFVSTSDLNFTKYNNPAFDMLFEKGVTAKTKKESLKYFAEAEQILIDDAIVVPLWYPENFKLFQANVQGFIFNPLKYADYSKVYFKPEQIKNEE